MAAVVVEEEIKSQIYKKQINSLKVQLEKALDYAERTLIAWKQQRNNSLERLLHSFACQRHGRIQATDSRDLTYPHYRDNFPKAPLTNSFWLLHLLLIFGTHPWCRLQGRMQQKARSSYSRFWFETKQLTSVLTWREAICSVFSGYWKGNKQSIKVQCVQISWWSSSKEILLQQSM